LISNRQQKPVTRNSCFSNCSCFWLLVFIVMYLSFSNSVKYLCMYSSMYLFILQQLFLTQCNLFYQIHYFDSCCHMSVANAASNIGFGLPVALSQSLIA